MTRTQVQELIVKEGKLHEELTQFFKETYPPGQVKQDLVYELPNDRFLLVFDASDVSTPGKEDIYPKDYFLRMIRWTSKVREDYKNKRGSSFAHWFNYSKNKLQLVKKVDDLVDELSQKLRIEKPRLDFSYKSLDEVSEKSEKLGVDEIEKELYDNLVAYVGEVIKRRVNGHWEIDKVPYISINDKWIHLVVLAK